MRVIAANDAGSSGPVSAILIRSLPDRHELIRWWGGYEWEILEESVPAQTSFNDHGYREVSLLLPRNWESGYLTLDEGQVRFRYGSPARKPSVAGREGEGFLRFSDDHPWSAAVVYGALFALLGALLASQDPGTPLGDAIGAGVILGLLVFLVSGVWGALRSRRIQEARVGRLRLNRGPAAEARASGSVSWLRRLTRAHPVLSALAFALVVFVTMIGSQLATGESLALAVGPAAVFSMTLGLVTFALGRR